MFLWGFFLQAIFISTFDFLKVLNTKTLATILRKSQTLLLHIEMPNRRLFIPWPSNFLF